MKAAIVKEPGQTPSYGNFAAPDPSAGEVRVTVTAAALSQLTRGRASGMHYSSENRFPFVAGVDGVGRLDDGRRVYFVLPRKPHGAMAEQTVVSLGQCLPIPDDLEDAMAAVIANPGMSSWAALTERAKIRPGETVLVNGATGASGRLAVKIARHLGASRVIATGRSSAVLGSLAADATVVLDQDEDTLTDAFLPHFAAGVDVVLDYLWGMSAHSLLISAAKAGREGVPMRFVQIGAVSGAEVALPSAVLRSSAITMMGSGLGSVGLDRLVAAIRGVLGAAREADLTVEHRAVPLSEVSTTWTQPEQGKRIVYTLGSGAD